MSPLTAQCHDTVAVTIRDMVRVNIVLLTPLTGGEIFDFTFTRPQLYMLARLI